ncbi:mpv17-like protein isoform X4 [Motacilla alba alba]|uniref:mpv17-like protein isoform X4 n=1 Tax=Motacilla alba alba TaxID=1094192 RepID=UPI0018D55570|nr:mpv17-like protein isoform X4 [Motacilla alba alba]
MRSFPSVAKVLQDTSLRGVTTQCHLTTWTSDPLCGTGTKLCTRVSSITSLHLPFCSSCLSSRRQSRGTPQAAAAQQVCIGPAQIAKQEHNRKEKAVTYSGMSILQRKEDIFSDCKKKFWNTYKLSNFILIPVHLRTAYTGLCGFAWASFICFSQQSGDGTAKSAFLWLQGEKVNADEESSDK